MINLRWLLIPKIGTPAITTANLRQTGPDKCDRYNAIVAMNCHGIVAYRIYDTTINTNRYHHFVEHCLGPAMQHYPGRNSIVIHDNASFHASAVVEEAINAHGGVVLRLPTYSPQKNPIELLFALTKSWLRRHYGVMEEYPELALPIAWRSIPNEYFRNWAEGCGYNFTYVEEE